MATDAFGANEVRLTAILLKADSLMTTIPTRHVATSAANTLLVIKLRIYNGVPVKFGR
jgi:hypothetical protein